MIKEVVVKGKDIMVRYESEKWIFYRKICDIPTGMKGVKVLPQSVIKFMREYPNRVR